jgi:hypothetical protein
MGRYIKTKIVTDGLIYLNDAGNSKSYSGVGTAIKNLVGYGATNTSFNQTFVSSGTTSHFISTTTSSYISNTNVSVSASTGSGFTICMMVKPQTLTNNDGWNYWFQQQSETGWIEFGRYGTSNGWEIKDNIKIEGQKVFTSVGTTTWTVPVGVTSITAVCVGGGGGAGGGDSNYDGAGGGGGGLSYGSTISVTPGDVLYIRVGAGGTGGRSYNYDNNSSQGSAGNAGESSYIKTGSHSGTALLEGGGGDGGEYGIFSNAVGGSGGTSSGTMRDNGGSGGNGGNGSSTRGGGGGGGGGYTGNGGNGGGGTTAINGSNGSGGGGGGGGNSPTSTFGEVRNPGGGVGIYGSGANGFGGTGGASTLNGNSGSPGSEGSRGTASTGNGLNDRSVGGLYGGGGGSRSSTATYNYVRDGGDGGQGAVRIVWGTSRSYPTTNISNPIPATQSTSFSDWTFVVFGVTTDYYTFISTNGSTKTLGSSNDWTTAPQINLNKIFGTGTSNYSCLWNNVMIYNRELTNEEIQINFEAFRGKFNL